MTLTIKSCDWLSGSATLAEPFNPKNIPGIRCELQKLSTRVFSEWWILKDGIYPIMDLLIKPKTPILHPMTAHFKLHNSVFYKHHGADNDMDYFKRFGLHNAKPTRVDVCADFNLFRNALNPASFITRISRGIYLRKHGGRFKLEATQSRTPSFHYLRYGSATSPVSLYLYNKSKELKEVKAKPWITSMWQKKGLDMTKDVWRLEFSIKDTRMHFLNTSTGEDTSLHSFSHLKASIINDVFNACMKRYGTFVRNNWKQNITRMPLLQLFDEQHDDYAIYLSPPGFDHSNMQKFTIKQLATLENELRATKLLNDNHILQTIADYERVHKLTGYHKNYLVEKEIFGLPE